MPVWKEIALSEDLPDVFERNIDGLVPHPGTIVGGSSGYCLNAEGGWTRVRSENNDINSFGGLTDAPDYNTNEVDKAVKYVRGIRISSLTHDSGTNTVTVYCLDQHELSASDTVTIAGCNVSAYNGSKTVASVPGNTSFTFSSSDSTAVTVPGYITGTTVDDNMLIFADDAGISDHSIGLTKLPELTAMRVIGSKTGGDAEEVVIDLTPANASTNLITSGAVHSGLADKLDLSGGTMTSHIEMDGNKLKFATDEFITGDGTNLNLESGGAINLVSVGGDTAILIGDADEASRFEVKLHAQGVSPMLAVTGEADAQSDFCIYEAGGSSADDLFRIRVSEHGQTAISTIDNAGADADMQIIADGQLLLSGVSGTKIAMSVLDDASDVDGAASGDIIYEPTSYSSGVTGVPGKCYYIKGNSNTWSESDASNSGTTSNLIAIATNANASKGLVLRGIVKLSHDVGGDPGDPVYLSETAAELTTTAPTASGAFVRVVGYLISTVSSKSTIYFNPDNTYIEIA